MTERRAGAPPPAEAEHPDLSCPQPAVVFGLLFDAHAAALHRYLARRVGATAADDLVSETFLVALQRRHSYDPARAAVRSWLYGIATNLLRGHLRTEVRGYQATARAAGAVRPHEDGHDGRVAARVDAETATRGLAGALAGLAPGDRDVLLLTSWAGLDSTEVAEALDIPVGTVRSRLHRVRRGLRAHAPNPSEEDTR
ncbi:RNA polymerase sigma factor [Crossiella cryophila]|uniref:RNA polymerase sigma-70 factor (ECF subfamily) n=1 Tax=Crossiella cryophila TaxID=43355 RepID=A0A7W7C6D2_9PSEU|nr:RNA polymerase sigma factor [Crossiella cryophila]MBB4675341.1 RNA polymerase sigma-70 factor (ECF subfamily) [Crossiella cryophila]